VDNYRYQQHYSDPAVPDEVDLKPPFPVLTWKRTSNRLMMPIMTAKVFPAILPPVFFYIVFILTLTGKKSKTGRNLRLEA